MAYYFIIGSPTTAATAFAGGVTGINGRGVTWRVTFGGTWNVGDTFEMQLVTPAVTYQLGLGNVSDVSPTACLTLSNRVHFIAGSRWYFSDNGDPTGWDTQSPGAGYIDCSNNFKASETLVSMAAYQGSMALFSNNTVQIWIINADPTAFQLKQVLANIGSYCPLGPQSIGDLDVIFPSLTGFRSLRVRDSSNNAFVNDIGSPVDLLIQSDLQAAGFSNLTTTCSIVEPTANRFWHYVNGKIYVLSYFPSAKIPAAWSTYTPEYFVGATLTAFVPKKFLLIDQQVFILATVGSAKHVFCFGYNTSGVLTYDATVATVYTHWLDLGRPAIRKQAQSVDYAITGAWQISGSLDYEGVVNNGGSMQNITNAAVQKPSFQLGQQAWSDSGFNVRLGATSAYAGYAVLSSFVFHFQPEKEK